MTRAILADTGPLYALADPSDQFHKQAGQELADIDKRGVRVSVSYATLCEVYTLVMRRLGGSFAHQWLAEVLAGAVPVALTTSVERDVADPDPEVFVAVTLTFSR